MSNLQETIDLASLGLGEYEGNETVIEVVNDLKIFFNNPTSCLCSTDNCYEKIGFINFLKRHFEIKGLEKNELDIFVKAQLMAMQIKDNENQSSKSRICYKYCYNSSIRICQNVFMKLCGISQYMLLTLQNDLKANGLAGRLHGNLKRAPRLSSHAYIDLDYSVLVKNFIIQYGEIHGYPSPLCHKNDAEVFVYLPTEDKFTTVYHEFVKYFEEEYIDKKIISLTTFKDLWKSTVPHIKFQKSATDLCQVCEDYKKLIKLARSNSDLSDDLKERFNKHTNSSNLECEHYNNNINLSKENSDIAHICYDWAQNVTIPYFPQQIGAMYFKTGFAAHIFGVCKTGVENYQLNFLIGEDEFPEGIKKGANTTLNLVYYALNKFSRIGINHLNITCDNCTGQNKNNLSLWFWAWLIMLGWYETITVNFMIPGHTKFICDSFFGHIKKVYRDTRINKITDVEVVINKSARGNETIRCNNDLGWIWYNFSNFFENNFDPLPNIKQYHHFMFSNSHDDFGKVYASKESGGVEECFKLLKNSNFNINGTLNTIPIAPLTEVRRKYLFRNVRQHVDEEFRDVHFSEF